MTDDYTGRMIIASVQLLSWSDAHLLASPLRRAVFILEQGVSESMEWDDMDAVSVHALLMEAGECIATGRLLPVTAEGDASLGRMAVRRDRRRQGIGSMILARLLGEARQQGARRVLLHAQLGASGFYRQAGFVETGAEFKEAGIAHVLMEQRLYPTAKA